MPRRKTKEAATSVAEAPAIESAPDVFDQVIATQPAATPAQQTAIVHAPSDNSHPPAAEREAAHENGHAARFTPSRQEGQSHAEAVGKRPQIVESGITYSANDQLAGARLGEGFRISYGRKVREGIIKFAERPSEAVIQMMNDAGFTYLGQDKLWTYPVRESGGWQDRDHVQKTFAEVTAAVRAERGINHGYGGVA